MQHIVANAISFLRHQRRALKLADSMPAEPPAFIVAFARGESVAGERRDIGVTAKSPARSRSEVQSKSVLAGSAITLFLILPIPSISIRTTSPTFSPFGGFIAAAPPPRAPVEMP